MKLVVGLGNPGKTYNFTRHNFGFLTLDFYYKKNALDAPDKSLFSALIRERGGVFFVKPQDFYNNSGKSVKELAHYYKIAPEDILAVCDDFNLPFGTLRFRESGSAGGNNGLKSLIAELKTENFPRLRLGTGNDELRRKIGDTDFVLSRFTPEEKSALPAILTEACHKIDDFLA